MSVVAEYRGNRSDAVAVPVVLINPAIFVTDGVQGRIFNEDGSVNRVGLGADPGSTVSIYVTGEGLTDPPGIDGQIAGENPPKPVVGPVQVYMDGREGEVVSFGGVQGQPAGLFLVRAKVPAEVQRGVPVAVTVGVNGNYTPDLVTIFVKP